MERNGLTRSQMALMVLGTAFLSYISSKYFFTYQDMCHYLVFLNYLENPGLYPQDLLAQSLSAHHTYFWHGVAALSSEASRPWFLLGLYIAISLFTGWAYLVYGSQVIRDKWTLLIFLFLFLRLWKCPVQHDLEISGSEMSQTEFVTPFLVLSLVLYMRGRYALAMFLASLMLNLQGQKAFYFLFAYSVALLPELRRLGLKGMAAITLAVLVGTSPLLLHFQGLSGNGLTHEQLVLYDRIVHLRNSNVCPLGFSLTRWQALGFYVLTGIIGWKLKGEHTIEERRLLRLVPGVLILMLCGVVFVDVYLVHPIFHKLVLFKSTIILVLVFAIYSAQFMHYFLRQREIFSRLVGLAWFLVFVFNMKINPEFVAPLMLCTLLAYRYKRLFHEHPHPDTFFKLTFVGIVCALVILRGIIPLAKGEFPSPLRKTWDPSWLDVQLWARNNTPVEARFITPFYFHGFRIFSQRGTVVERRDGTPLLFSPALHIEWARRMEDFGLNLERDSEKKSHEESLRKLYVEKSRGEFERLADKYQASYLVMPRERAARMDLPLVYENDGFSVYRLLGD